MLTIGYRILPLDREVSPLGRPDGQIDLALVSEMDLRYEYFWSAIDFVIQGRNIGERWGSLPLLDFAASLRLSASGLVSTGEAFIDFTENSEVVTLSRRDTSVEIGYAPAGAALECGLQDYLAAVDQFLKEVVESGGEEYPRIRDNAFFMGLRGTKHLP